MTASIDLGLAKRVVAIVRAVGDQVKLEASVIDGVERHRKTSLGDLVTSLDTIAEARLKEALGPVFPDAGFIGEEAGSDGAHAHFTWILDPIDGTTNVIHGVEYAAVSVALVRAGSPVLGVVHDIYRGASYFSVAGAGAFVSTADHPLPEPIATSTIAVLAESLVSFGLPYDRARSDSIFAAASKVLAVSQDLRRQGSAALDVVGVAAGTFQAHFELDLRVWDVAAASLILSEAGGRLTTWTNEPVLFSDVAARIPVLASNGLVHAELASVLAS